MRQAWQKASLTGFSAIIALSMVGQAAAYRASDLEQRRVQNRMGSGTQVADFQESNTASVSSSSLSSSSSSISSAPMTVEEQQVACLRVAMQKRENTILQGFNSYYTYVATALKARSIALGMAFDLSDAALRKNAKSSVWKGFGFTWREAGTTMREIRRNAWLQFRNDRLACGIIKDDEAGGYGMDSQF